MNKVLVVAVHADDETLGCGGTLLKHKAQGDEIYWLLLTGPVKMPQTCFSDEHIQQRAERVSRIAKAYGFDGLDYLELPTQLLHTLDLRDIIKRISEVFKRIQPNIIYTMFANDVHSDHRVAFDAVYSCTKSFRYPFIEKIYMMETLSETEFALSVPAKTFIPNVYVDITDFIDRKLEIMQMYPKEVMAEPYPRSLSSIKALARVRGSRAGVMYAETFQLLYERK
ncbi:MAG: PIG-L family deacetylase [Bacteroidales bacterium]|nr:PIG-L family deacetylase [Bacteroidales bacterium]